MAVEIEFSILSDEGGNIRPLLEAFEAETSIHVRCQVMDWESAWNQLVRAAIYNDGPDVSEIGTSWTGDLVGMNALRPFNPVELATMGRSAAFVPVAWKNAVHTGEKIWSIPWASGARVIFYRPRLLEQAGVDLNTAFASAAALDDTVSCLHKAGVRVPWIPPVGRTGATLHNIASWIWGAGGSFVRPDGRALAVMEPEALEGMTQYFALGRYLAPVAPLLGPGDPEGHFVLNDDVAMCVSGSWLYRDLPNGRENEFAVAQLPGPSFVGGSNLVIWKYAHQPDAAVQLVRFLTSQAAQVDFCPKMGLLPSRVDALEAEPFASNPFWKASAAALWSGKGFPATRLWGVIEDRLTTGFGAVWDELFRHPGSDPRDILVRTLTPLCHRLNLLLQER